MARYLHGPLIRRLSQFVKRHDVQMLHLNNTLYRCFAGVLVAKRFGLPCVCHLRSTNSGEFNRVMRRIGEKYVDRFIAVSESTGDYWKGLGVPRDSVEVVYNGIQHREIVSCQPRLKFSIPTRFTYLIGVVAMLLGFKGHDFLLEAFRRVLEARDDVALLVVGDGPLRQRLEAQVAEAGIAESVWFLGHQPDAQSIIAGLDCLVVPSKAEPFGRVTIEAMQSGVAVIATNTGGSPEVVEDGGSGILVSFGDVDGLTEAMKRVLSHSELRERFGARGRQIVRERFSVDRYVRSVEKIYEAVLSFGAKN